MYQLTVHVDRLKTWHRPGLLYIGPKLRFTTLDDSDLPLVQVRREFPTRITQKFQVTMLRDRCPKDLHDTTAHHLLPIFTAFRMAPLLPHVMGRFIGLGVRQEHISNS